MASEMSEAKKEGWGLPTLSKKWHYFVDIDSLCRRWGFYFGVVESGNDDSPDNCSTCMKLLAKRKAKATER
jgi:hypothetical protein